MNTTMVMTPERAWRYRHTNAIVDRVNKQHAALAIRRCADCRMDLGGEGWIIRAAFECPLFGQLRFDAELRCPSFVAKEARP